MSAFTDQYLLYLIKQYWEKPKAKAEIEMLLNSWSGISDFLLNFGTNFDIDNAEGDVLDLIGRIVGLNRQVNSVVPISYFGFSLNSSAKGFSDKFNEIRSGAPFFNKFGEIYSPYQLQDAEYRKFLKIKIAKNTCSPYLASDEKISLQQVVFDAFDGGAYVVDNKDQALTLYVSPTVNETALRIIINLDILPRPITFSYRIIIQAEPGETFGFSNNPNSKGFSDKFDPSRVGGVFARKLLNV
jgi:hypothetical protein